MLQAESQGSVSMPPVKSRTPAQRRADHERVRERWRLFRDVALSTVAGWMLIHETLSHNPQPIILGVALVLLGLPPALRAGIIDDIFKR